MSLRKARSNNQFKDSWLCNDFYKSRLECKSMYKATCKVGCKYLC